MPQSDALTFLRGTAGRSAAAFGNKFADGCNLVRLEPVVCDDGKTRNYRAHGLRKAACKKLAHAGCTAMEIMAVAVMPRFTEVHRRGRTGSACRGRDGQTRSQIKPGTDW